jgi:DNA-binding beta-propeller fold protein YncE
LRTTGCSNGQFDDPTGIASDNSGNIYVSDKGNSRIQVFSSTGTYITQWGSYGDCETTGCSNGQFDVPEGIAVDSSGNVYVVDMGNARIEVFHP